MPSNSKSSRKIYGTERPWKPSVIIGQKENTGDHESQEEVRRRKLLKTFLGCLNKITVCNYEIIESNVGKLDIQSDKDIIEMVNILYEKAVNEYLFCSVYSKLCNFLSSLAANNINFQELLLMRCREEFEASFIRPAVNNEMVIPSVAESHDEAEDRQRKRAVGNIRLIGHLYLMDVMSEADVVGIIERLCQEVKNESLEYLCTLLRTTGHKLDIEYSLEGCCAYLRNIINSKPSNISTRIRFMMQDIMEMRDNSWRGRARFL